MNSLKSWFAPIVSNRGLSPIVLLGTVIIEDTVAPVSQKVMDILDSGGQEDILAALVQKPEVNAAAVAAPVPELINQLELPRIIETLHPDLDDNDKETLREVGS